MDMNASEMRHMEADFVGNMAVGRFVGLLPVALAAHLPGVSAVFTPPEHLVGNAQQFAIRAVIVPLGSSLCATVCDRERRH